MVAKKTKSKKKTKKSSSKKKKTRRPRVLRKRRGRTIVRIHKQTGKTRKSRDRLFSALPPGKRISANGKIYYEYRRNRSDINPRKGL